MVEVERTYHCYDGDLIVTHWIDCDTFPNKGDEVYFDGVYCMVLNRRFEDGVTVVVLTADKYDRQIDEQDDKMEPNGFGSVAWVRSLVSDDYPHARFKAHLFRFGYSPGWYPEELVRWHSYNCLFPD